jgi:hypothetical protein
MEKLNRTVNSCRPREEQVVLILRYYHNLCVEEIETTVSTEYESLEVLNKLRVYITELSAFIPTRNSCRHLQRIVS